MKNTSTHQNPARQRRLHRLLTLNIALLAGLIGYRILHPPPPTVGGGEPESTVAHALKQQVYASISPDDEQGFTRLDPDNPGSWLLAVKEPVQTLEAYQAQQPTRPTPTRRTIVLQPLGPMNQEQTKLLETLRDYTSIFFQLPTRLAEPIAFKVPAQWTRPGWSKTGGQTQQWDAEKIVLGFLGPRLPQDAVAGLGVTASDIWAGHANFVFGVGDGNYRTAVYSLCRYYPEFWGHPRREGDEVQALRRACKVLNHEIGHIFGLGHCVFYHCSMNGMNSLGELDEAPIDYCPLCHHKLQWNIGFDAVHRYQALHEFYQQHGLTEEANWVSDRIERWKHLTASQTQLKT